jgi:hypothetical protein
MAVLVFNIKHGECPTLVIYVYKLGNCGYCDRFVVDWLCCVFDLWQF